MSVDMLGAIIPNTSICSVVQEMARQIDHFIRELVELTLDLRRVYEAPFHDRPGRLPLWQEAKREEAGFPSQVTNCVCGVTLKRWSGLIPPPRPRAIKVSKMTKL